MSIKQFPAMRVRHIVIGKVFEVASINYKCKYLICYDGNQRLDSIYFDFNEVQICTGHKFEGKEICVGDWVSSKGISGYVVRFAEDYIIVRGGIVDKIVSYLFIDEHEPKNGRINKMISELESQGYKVVKE